MPEQQKVDNANPNPQGGQGQGGQGGNNAQGGGQSQQQQNDGQQSQNGGQSSNQGGQGGSNDQNGGKGGADGKGGNQQSNTILDDQGKPKGDQQQQQNQSDWRKEVAGEDVKDLALANRYSSIKDVFNALKAAQAQLSSGDLKKALPKDATPEQVAQYRKDNGIPDKAEDYKIELSDGLVVGEEDKAEVGDFVKSMHDLNMKNDDVNKVLDKYFHMREQESERRRTKDEDFKQNTIATLSREWGNEYEPNKNLIRGLLDTMPPELGQLFATARLGNGESLMNTPAMANWLVHTSRTINPVSAIVPPGGDQAAAITNEKATLEKLMGDKKSEYWVGPKAATNQKRYNDLVGAEQAMKARGQAA